MLIVFIRTIILFVLIITLMRIMGKRQIGQLQASELVVSLIIADLAAIPMGNVGIPLLSGIVPILTLFIGEAILSYISLRSQTARKILSGKPSIIISKGKIVEKELNKQRFSIDDLVEQLRIKNVSNIEDVEYAILETGGNLSIILKTNKMPVLKEDLNIDAKYEGLPITLIIDGILINENLSAAGLNINWINNELKINKISSVKDILFAFVTNDKVFKYQLKESQKG
ncbi:MAG: DUF421 domain-containing protein [Firmicutes bacterium]|nr:DUF421 domain-containing protein [Bacillota bacterium]